MFQMDGDVSVGSDAFARIAPAVPIISNVFVNDTIFEVLTASTGGRLHFSAYDKYINGLEKYVPLYMLFVITFLSVIKLNRYIHCLFFSYIIIYCLCIPR
ncbi:hypothetical protein Leryth_022906 [Lithospermum erythrorhizon]|nr:hypothetical protein Leryth_022906 [Lithospermum erythrorhizon]